MVLSKLTGRLPDSLRERLPGRPDGVPRPPVGTPDVPVDTPDGRPDADVLPGVDGETDDKLTLGLTVVALVGLALATVGVVGRLLLDRVRSRRADDTTAPTDEQSATEVSTTADEVAVETTVERDEGAATERDESATDTDEGAVGDEPADKASAGDEPAASTVLTDESTDDGSAESTGPPRIAPLVGMVALVGMKFVVDRLGGDAVEA